MDLYIGAYANYGLTDLSNASNRDVYQVNENTYIGVLASNQISKANLLSVGVKVGINLNLSKNKAPDAIPVQVTYETPYTEKLPVEAEVIPETIEIDVNETDTVSEEPTETVTIVVVDEEIDWMAIASEKASQIELHFAKNSIVPSNNLDSSINELSEILKNNPDLNILIIGHTCNLGSKEINQRIGLERAESVKDIMMKSGIPATRISTESRIYSEPLVPNTSELNRATNRRAEVKIVE